MIHLLHYWAHNLGSQRPLSCYLNTVSWLVQALAKDQCTFWVRITVLGFRVWVLGFKVLGLRVRVYDLGLGLLG